MTITRHATDGFSISTIYKGYRVEQRYIGYTLREAKAKFREYLKTL